MTATLPPSAPGEPIPQITPEQMQAIAEQRAMGFMPALEERQFDAVPDGPSETPANYNDPKYVARECGEMSVIMKQQSEACRHGSIIGAHSDPVYIYNRTAIALAAAQETIKRLLAPTNKAPATQAAPVETPKAKAAK